MSAQSMGCLVHAVHDFYTSELRLHNRRYWRSTPAWRRYLLDLLSVLQQRMLFFFVLTDLLLVLCKCLSNLPNLIYSFSWIDNTEFYYSLKALNLPYDIQLYSNCFSGVKRIAVFFCSSGIAMVVNCCMHFATKKALYMSVHACKVGISTMSTYVDACSQGSKALNWTINWMIANLA